MLEALTQKIFLEVDPPGNGDNLADKERIINWLKEKYALEVSIPYPLLAKFIPSVEMLIGNLLLP